MNASELPDETLFEAALKCRTPAERAAYLDQACAGQPELRLKVEALFRAHDRAGQFLDLPVAATATLKVDLPPDDTPGTMIGRYKLLQRIGEGGCGVVYMAEQAEPVRRRVAVKIIKLGMDTKSVIARFEAERQALAMMDHPNIAKVFDAGTTERGRPYFVMELVRGMKITEYCDEKKLPTRARLDLFIQVCQAIQHAHQKGIIHRDIKPSNVLVTVNDGVAVPKVIDFGIAKATSGQQLTDKTLFTAFEQFIGTPAYMSPEQAVLTSLDIDTRSDIYALGVLLYELLTGKTPFDASELLAIGLDEMRRTIREREPARPSTRLSTLPDQELGTTAQRRGLDAPKLVTELRGDLDWIVMKALEKDRARRYETANGLARDIQRHLHNEPVVARPPSSLYRLQKMVRRNRLGVAAAGAVLLALVSGLALATWALVRERAARQQTRTQAARSETVARFLKDMLNGVEPSVALGRDTTMLREILDKTAERVGNDLKNEPLVEAELRTTIGQVYFALGASDKAAAMHRAALTIRNKLLGDDHVDAAHSLNGLGVALDYLERYPEAEPLLRKALAVRRKHLSGDHPDVATSLHNLGHVLASQAKFTDANPLYLEALAMRKRLFGNEHLDVARSLTAIGQQLRGQGKLIDAEASFRETLAMRRKLVGNEHVEVCHSIGNLANTLKDLGRLDEAESLFREGLAIQRKLTGDHPGTGFMLTRLGFTLQAQGRLDEAESLFRESMQMHGKLLGEDHSETALAFRSLVYVLQKQGKFAAAEPMLREKLAISRKRFGNENPGTAWWRHELARNLHKQGKLAEAEETAREAIDHLRKAAEKGDSATLNQLAWYLATSPIPAIRDGRSAVAFAEKAVAATSRTHPGYLDTLAAAHAEAGDFAKAVAIEQEAIAMVPPENAKEDMLRLKLYQSNTPYREP